MLTHIKTKSEKLLDDLSSSLTNKADKKEIQKVIRHYFCQIHNSAVEQTKIACNRREFVPPQFLDL